MKDVVVFGSINMDVVTFCRRHPLVGETIFGEKVAFFPGGKGANQAVASARCAGKSLLIGSVGPDGFGKQMLTHLKENGVELSGISTEAASATGVAIIVVDEKGQNSIIVTPGANGETKSPAALSDLTPNSVIALAQLESPVAEITKFFGLVQAGGGTTILNPSPYQPLPQELLARTSIMIVNEHEFSQLTGKPLAVSPQEVVASVRDGKLPVACCIITLGGDGFVIAQRDQTPIHVAGQKVTPVDTTGAGDCFAGWFAAELAGGAELEQASRRANKAAALSVMQAGAGTSAPTKADVDALV